MPKTDYYDDPGAPRANSLVVAVTAVVLDDAGRVLLIQRTDNDLWAVPGGAQEVGETSTEATVRQEFSLCFRARPIGGPLTSSSESKHVHWVEPDRLDKRNIHPSVQLRIEHGLQQRPQPYLS